MITTNRLVRLQLIQNQVIKQRCFDFQCFARSSILVLRWSLACCLRWFVWKLFQMAVAAPKQMCRGLEKNQVCEKLARGINRWYDMFISFGFSFWHVLLLGFNGFWGHLPSKKQMPCWGLERSQVCVWKLARVMNRWDDYLSEAIYHGVLVFFMVCFIL